MLANLDGKLQACKSARHIFFKFEGHLKLALIYEEILTDNLPDPILDY